MQLESRLNLSLFKCVFEAFLSPFIHSSFLKDISPINLINCALFNLIDSMKDLCDVYFVMVQGTVLFCVQSVSLINCSRVICLIVENVCIHSIYLNLKLIL